ncbi:hypothetical protein EDM76_13855, partial [bacterium]
MNEKSIKNLFLEPYRLFFAGGSLYAVLAVALWFTWLHLLDHQISWFDFRVGPAQYHSHVMLFGVMGGLALLLVVSTPVYLLSSSITALEEENAEITAALRQIGRSRGRIAAMRAEQAARDARYEQGAPGEQWLPTQVQEHGLSFSRVQHEPERVVGRYRIHTTRASFQGAGLRPAILLLADMKNSRYPVAIERLHVDHHQA